MLYAIDEVVLCPGLLNELGELAAHFGDVVRMNQVESTAADQRLGFVSKDALV
jgi:hypothetical protein